MTSVKLLRLVRAHIGFHTTCLHRT